MIRAIEMQDNYSNKFYLINEGKSWYLVDKNFISHSLSTISSQATELQINLANSDEDSLGVVQKYADYADKDTIKYYEAR